MIATSNFSKKLRKTFTIYHFSKKWCKSLAPPFQKSTTKNLAPPFQKSCAKDLAPPFLKVENKIEINFYNTYY
jgi:hypothetical protein